jgi:heat shock protein HtpX
MHHAIAAYARRLDLRSILLLGGLGLGAATLGWGLYDLEGAVAVLTFCLVLALVRTGGSPDLPGTLAIQPWQAPGLFTLVESLSRRAGLHRVPEVRIVPGGQTNAAATLRGRLPVLVVTEALLARMDSRRLGAVLAHEVAHLAHRDLWMFRVALTFQAATTFLGFFILFLSLFLAGTDPVTTIVWSLVAAAAPIWARWLVAALSRTREYAADLGATRLTGDPVALAEALEIIEYRPRTWWDWMMGRRSPVPTDPAADAFRTHPPTVERVRRLDLLAEWT